MSKPARWTAAAFLTVLLLASVLNRFLKQAPESAIEVMELGNTFVMRTNEALVPSAREVDCGQSAEIKKSVNEELYWQSDEGPVPETFIFFDTKTRELAGCHRGEAFAGKILAEVGGQPGEIEMFRINEAQFGPSGAEGKPEFFIYHGNCLGKACSGEYWLMQLRGKQIQNLFTVAADGISRLGAVAAVLKKECFTDKYGPGPGFFAIAEFEKDGGLRLLPYGKIAQKYPAVLAGFVPPSGADKIFVQIHELYHRAYNGEPLEQVLKSYDELVKTAPPGGLNLHCDPRENLETISGK